MEKAQYEVVSCLCQAERPSDKSGAPQDPTVRTTRTRRACATLRFAKSARRAKSHAVPDTNAGNGRRVHLSSNLRYLAAGPLTRSDVGPFGLCESSCGRIQYEKTGGQTTQETGNRGKKRKRKGGWRTRRVLIRFYSPRHGT